MDEAEEYPRVARRWVLRWLSSPVAVATLAPALSAGTALIVNILSARALGPDGRGTVAFVLQLGYLATPFLVLGRDRAMLRSNVGTTGLSAPLLLLGTALALPWLSGPSWFVIPVAWCSAHIAIARAAALGSGRTQWFAGWMFAYQMSILLGSTLLFALDIKSAAWWLVPYSVPMLGVAVYELFVTVRARRQAWSGMFAHLPLAPASIAGIVVMRLDRVLLPILTSVRELGLYVAVATATESIAWLANAIADRSVGRTDGSRSGLVALIRTRFPMILVASAMMGPVVYFAVEPVFGREFRPAEALVVPLTLSAVALSIYRMAVAQLLASVRPAASSFVEILTAVAAAAVYFLLIREHGMHGAAWASVVIYVMGTGIAIWVLSRKPRGPGQAGDTR